MTGRYTVRDTSSGEESVLHVSKEQAQGGSDSHLRDPKTGRELEVVDKVRAVRCGAAVDCPTLDPTVSHSCPFLV